MLSESERAGLLEESEKVKQQILEAYTDLGEKVYDRYREEPTAFSAEMEWINAGYRRLEEIDLQLNPPEPITIELDPMAKFDPITGKPLKMDASEANSIWFCESCGKKMVGIANFCQYCGTPKHVQASEPEVHEVTATIAAVQEQVQKEVQLRQPVQEEPQLRLICPSCGKEGKNGRRFCVNCGTKLVEGV